MNGKVKALVVFLMVALTFSVWCGGKTESKTDNKAKSNVVVVYSPAPEAMLNLIIKEFQEKTGIKVELVQAGSGELLTRIKSEKENPLADVMFGGGAEAMEAHKDYFAAYTSPQAANVRPQYKNAAGYWTGVFVSPTVIMYNKKLVPQNEVPTGWADFANPKWKGKVSFADPVASGSSFTAMSIMLAAMDNGDGGWGYIKQFVDVLSGKLLASSSAPHKGVSGGEYHMCITQEQAVLLYIKAGADNVGIVYPKEGTGAVPSAVSLIKGAPNNENAKKFIDFVLSADVQARMPDFLYHLVRTDVKEAGIFTPLSEIALAPQFDFLKSAQNKDEYIKKWNNVVSGR